MHFTGVFFWLAWWLISVFSSSPVDQGSDFISQRKPASWHSCWLVRGMVLASIVRSLVRPSVFVLPAGFLPVLPSSSPSLTSSPPLLPPLPYFLPFFLPPVLPSSPFTPFLALPPSPHLHFWPFLLSLLSPSILPSSSSPSIPSYPFLRRSFFPTFRPPFLPPPPPPNSLPSARLPSVPLFFFSSFLLTYPPPTYSAYQPTTTYLPYPVLPSFLPTFVRSYMCARVRPSPPSLPHSPHFYIQASAVRVRAGSFLLRASSTRKATRTATRRLPTPRNCACRERSRSRWKPRTRPETSSDGCSLITSICPLLLLR